MAYSVSEMEAIVRSRFKEPSQARISSAEILQVFNDGYKDVSAKAFCIENEDIAYTTAGDRLVPFNGHRVNFVHFMPEFSERQRDYFWISCEATISEGYFGYPIPAAPTFSLTSGLSYIDDLFPLTLSIYSDLPVEEGRTIHYTTDGATPDETSTLYDEIHIHITGFSPSDPYGTIKTIKAVVFKNICGIVATFEIIKMGDFLYDTREYWSYDLPVLTGGEIDSGAYIEMVVSAPATISEPNLKFAGGEVSSGTYTEIVVLAPADLEEPAAALLGGIINQGKWWDPIVETEPPWD